MLNFVRLRYLWFAISLLVIVPGLIFLLMPGGGLRVGIDFAGGNLWEFVIPNPTRPVTSDEVRRLFEQAGIEASPPQVARPDEQGRVIVTVRTPEVQTQDPRKQQVVNALTQAYPGATLSRFESVGETVSRESTRQAIFAVLLASLAILGYLTFAFRKAPHPFRYGACAIIAMLHDVILVLGVAAMLGYFIGLEVDALFLTALLTVISFSVHDTIVVFDRIRENLKLRRSSESFEEIVNLSIVQTLTRSINTQLTTLLTLLALLLFGGETIRHFVLILTIGLLSGTYSSIFNAAQLLVVWENGWTEDWRRIWRRAQPPTQVTA
ncbi:protein translocase subunit SecF [Kallotenue papyrolyticum]|uniref:protein translocase subunit SecF n=1 Tax=Kallotenue papyrolyticum TaxID=1325125 RepID=UPI000478625F|nr:protein translocase subunit SecF [Kallotenue papyrolyticum]